MFEEAQRHVGEDSCWPRLESFARGGDIINGKLTGLGVAVILFPMLGLLALAVKDQSEDPSSYERVASICFALSLVMTLCGCLKDGCGDRLGQYRQLVGGCGENRLPVAGTDPDDTGADDTVSEDPGAGDVEMQGGFNLAPL